MSAIPLLRRRRERQTQQRQRRQSHIVRGFTGCGVLAALLLGTGIILAAFAYASITAGLPPIGSISQMLTPGTGSLLQPSRIYDRSGLHSLAVLAPQNSTRSYVIVDPGGPLSRATVALIDPGFWKHPGYLLQDILNPEAHSTIAQKLVADLLLWDEPAGIRRAIRERILAGELTAFYGREKIIEWYLNSTNYGHYAYGVESAAQLYFGKAASQTNLAEAALLASVNISPAINPLDAPQAAIQQEQQALNIIEQQRMANADEMRLARLSELSFRPAPPALDITPAFTALVLSQLETNFSRARFEHGGMIALTTLDYDLQQNTDCYIQAQLARLGGTSGAFCQGQDGLAPLPPGQFSPKATASAAVLDPSSGEVLALVGDSRNGIRSGYLTPHQPGTLLTPFVYLAGFTRGLSPATLTWDVPDNNSLATNQLSNTAPRSYLGPIRLRTALNTDSLIPTSNLYQQMGGQLVHQTMAPFGFNISANTLTDLLQTQNRFSVIQIAQAYSVFAAQGTLAGQTTQDGMDPLALLAIHGVDGSVYAEWNNQAVKQIVSGQLAYLVTDVLSANLANLGRPLALKTGINPAQTGETWMAGYTPHRVAVLWMGGDKIDQRSAKGLWTAIMQYASQGLPADGWTQPAGVIRLKVCDPSGMLPTPACPNVVDEIFIDGYQPIQADSLFHTYEIDTQTGFLATSFTPPQLIKKQVFMIVPPEAAAWARIMGQPVPPDQYDTIHSSLAPSNGKITAPAMLDITKGKITIRGTAAGKDFRSYRLQFGQGPNPETWLPIGPDNTVPVVNDILATWDTNGLDGLYSVQLIIIRTDNTISTDTIYIQIKNP